MKYFWIALGSISIALGVIGILLPLLPTTPFLLLAAIAFSKGSQTMHRWLVTHKTLGPPIQAWQEHRAIARPVKQAATASLGVVFCLSIFMNVPWWALTAQGLILLCVAFFIWRAAEVP